MIHVISPYTPTTVKFRILKIAEVLRNRHTDIIEEAKAGVYSLS